MRNVKRKALKKTVFFRKLLYALFFLVTVFVIILALRAFSFYKTISVAKNGSSLVTEKKEELKNFSIALLGYGGGSHDGTFLTDTIIVANIDLVKKKVLLISVPRDLLVTIKKTNNDTYDTKINALYQMGLHPDKYKNIVIPSQNPASLLFLVLEEIIGLKPNSFIALDFEGFVKIVDTNSGITVNVEKAFTDYEYPIEEKINDLCGRDEEFAKIEPIINKQLSEADTLQFFNNNKDLEVFYNDIKNKPVKAFPCRYETLVFEKGPTIMDGQTALKFARSRHAIGDGGDFNRARRQQLVIDAIRNKAISINTVSNILPMLNSLEKNIKTDLTISQINNLINVAGSLDSYEIASFIVSDKYLVDDYSSFAGSILVSKDGAHNFDRLKNDIKNTILNITPTLVPKKEDPTITNIKK